MPLGYTRAPRVTGSNQESRTRRLSRSLTTGNNGTPMVFTLYSTEEQKIDASPVSGNTASLRPITRWFSTEFASNSSVDIGYWQNAGYISLRMMNTGATYWSVSYSSMASASANSVLFMNSTGYMTGDQSKLSFDATNTLLTVSGNSAATTPLFKLSQAGSGDCGINFLLPSVAGWAFGIDNSDTDHLKISKGNTIGSSDFILFRNDGATREIDIRRRVVVYQDDASTSSQLQLQQDGSGDSVLEFLLTGGQSAVIGIDNSDSDKLKISMSSSLGTSDCLTLDSSSNATFANSVEVTNGFSAGITTVSSNTTLNSTHYTVLVNASVAAVTITLPAVASSARRIYSIKKIDSSVNAVTVDANGSEQVDGADNTVLTSQWNSKTIQCDGVEWYIISSV